MSERTDLLKSALYASKTGWYRYLGVLWAINMALAIDFLVGGPFFHDTPNVTIAVAGLKVPRIAFSFTYSVFFGTFVVWAIFSTKAVREIVLTSGTKMEVIMWNPEFRLWGLSPIFPNRVRRMAFWILCGDGLILLGVVAVVHLFCWKMPKNMSPLLYQGIGVLCSAIFAFAVSAIIRWIYSDWKCVFDFLTSNDREH